MAAFLGAKKPGEKAVEASDLLLVFDEPAGEDEPEAPRQSASTIERMLLASAKANRAGVIFRKRGEPLPTTTEDATMSSTTPPAASPPPTEAS